MPKEKFLHHSNRERAFLFLLFSGISLLLLTPLFSNTYLPAIIDYINHLAGISQAKTALLQGQFPLRMAASEQHELAYPLFQFYSTTTYTIAGLIHRWLTPNNPYIAYKLTIFIALIFGGIYFYRLTAWLTQNKIAAVLGTLIFLISPYMMILINHLGAFNETIALAIVPVVVFYTLQTFFYNRISNFFLCAIAWYLLITIHLLTFLATSGVIFFWLLMLSFQQKQWHSLLRIIGIYCLSLILALWYLAPIVTLSKFFTINETFSSAKQFFKYSPTLLNLLSPVVNIGQGAELSNGTRDAISRVHPAVGIPIILGFMLSCHFLLKSHTKNNKDLNYLISPLLIIFLGIFLAIWSPINFWKWLPNQLLVFQYSWRLLGQLTWIGALLGTYVISQISFSLHQGRALVIALLIILANISWLFFPEQQAIFNDSLKDLPLTNAYSLDAMHNQQLVQLIDNLLINSSAITPQLNLASLKPMSISPQLLNAADAPYLYLQGKISTTHSDAKISVYFDHEYTMDFPITKGKFAWTIPLPKQKPATKPLLIAFKAPQKITIPLEKIEMKGFLNQHAVLDMNQLKKHCIQENTTTLCYLDIPNKIRLLELPTYYYPKMLNITVNDQPAQYISLFYGNNLLTAIAAQPGKMNKIKIEFTGLRWANFISYTAWQIFILFLIYALLKLKKSFTQIKIDEAPNFGL